MKKILLVTLALMTLILLAGCDTGSGEQSNPPSSNGVSAHVHEFGEWQTVKEPSCTEEGLEERVCKCEEKEEREISSLGHSYVSNVTEPTCTERGYTTYECACGKSRITDYVDKLGHDFTDFTVVTAPTCTEDGVEQRSCRNCGLLTTRDADATGHDFGEWIKSSDPTCEKAGAQKRECKNCSKAEYSLLAEALGHSFGDWYVFIPATCTEGGENRRECQHKGCTEYETRKTHSKGHSFGSWTVFTEPTCTENGESRRYCSGCDEYETKIIPPHEIHSFGEWITLIEPFCGNSGTKSRTCSHCSHSQIGTITSTECHSYGNWYRTSDSTVQRDCNNCSAHEMKRTAFSEHATVTAAVTITNKYYVGESNDVPYRRQGGCFNGVNAYQALISANQSCARIMKKNVVTGETVYSEIRTDMGHAQFIGYLPTTNCVYAWDGGGYLTFDADTLEYKGIQQVGDMSFFLGVCYLAESKTYIDSYGTIYDANFNRIDYGGIKFSGEQLGMVGQGSCTDGNYRYELACTGIKGKKEKYYTYINIWDLSDGHCVGNVTVDIPENFEPENISVVNGEIYIAACTTQPVVTFYKVVFD